jgi:N-acyl-D-aspartate/D-glutamate deacylase
MPGFTRLAIPRALNCPKDDMTHTRLGITEVLVHGTFVVRNGALVPDARPGRPVRIGPPAP